MSSAGVQVVRVVELVGFFLCCVGLLAVAVRVHKWRRKHRR